MTMEMEDYKERYSLAGERLREISSEHFGHPAFEKYFTFVAGFLLQMMETWEFVKEGKPQTLEISALREHNRALYEDILPEFYEESYANPAYAAACLGEEFGPVCSFIYYEMRSLIIFAYEQRLFDMVIRMELFLEVYGAFVQEWQETGVLPAYETIRQIIYYYAFDYADIAAEQRVEDLVCTGDNFAVSVWNGADLNDIRYLYAYGEYITENEEETARFLAGLPQETIDLMADTYTEGYRMGFVLGKKDLSKKFTVDIRYALGFERMIRKAAENFRKLGLSPAISRAAASILHNPTIYKSGFQGANPNKQYDYDHKDDKAIFLDKIYKERRLEVLRTAFEKYKEEARGYAGPAVMETFGEKEFEPVIKPQCIQMSEAQQSLWVEYRSGAGRIQREYILEEERSFTIIAFPVPEIGSDFPAIFEETIKINTLDYMKYQQIQQTIIDTLDQADYCEIKGSGLNRTDLKVNLYKLKNPEKETIFENCVADVNIPVGEVFTSPVLQETDGTLHVNRVFLNGLEYHDLSLTFTDGMVTDYNCGNFDSEEENKAFIKENILFHHKALPLSEFAIGTNTTAYAAARKYKMEAKLPILIAEKTGPHFAIGDTCYSHTEEIPVFNPDGKEIVARENEISMTRDKNPSGAYFNCHTDITIPYDELGELTAVSKDGKRTVILKDGRFVLPGCEELNEPLDGLK